MQTASVHIPLFVSVFFVHNVQLYNVLVQVVGRVFAGLGVGIVSCLVPLYQSEW